MIENIVTVFEERVTLNIRFLTDYKIITGCD